MVTKMKKWTNELTTGENKKTAVLTSQQATNSLSIYGRFIMLDWTNT